MSELEEAEAAVVAATKKFDAAHSALEAARAELYEANRAAHSVRVEADSALPRVEMRGSRFSMYGSHETFVIARKTEKSIWVRRPGSAQNRETRFAKSAHGGWREVGGGDCPRSLSEEAVADALAAAGWA